MSTRMRLLVMVTVAAASLSFTSAVHSAVLYWTNAGGSWIQIGGNVWKIDSISGTPTDWIDNSDAVFSGPTVTPPNTVTLDAGSTVSVNSLEFDVPGYIISGGTINLTGTGGVINANYAAAAANPGTDAQKTTINSNITGNVGLTKIGLGFLKLGGTNTYTGGTTLTAGRVEQGSANALPVGGDLTILQTYSSTTNWTRLDLGGNNATIGNLVADLPWASPGGASTITNFTGTTANLTLKIQGDVTIHGRGNDWNFNIISKVDLNNRVCTFDIPDNVNYSTGDFSITNPVSNGGVNKINAGVMRMNGANTYAGQTTIAGGVLSGVPQTTNINMTNGVWEITNSTTTSRGLGTDVGQIQITGGASGISTRTNALIVNLGGAAAPITWGSAYFNPSILVLNAKTANNALTFVNPLDLSTTDSQPRTISVQANTATIAGNMTDGGKGAGLIKTDGGLLALTGNNTYGGNTTINAGTLRGVFGVGLPNTTNLNIVNGVWETTANYAGQLGTGAGQVQVSGGISGFSAKGAPVALNFGGARGLIKWGDPTFNPTSLILNVSTADSGIDFQNALDLNTSTAAPRTIIYNANTAFVSGTISDSGAGAGLVLNSAATFAFVGGGSNTYGGPTAVQRGTVMLSKTDGAVAIPGDLNFGSGSTTLSPTLYATLPNQFGVNSTINFLNLIGGYTYFKLNGNDQKVAGINDPVGAGVIENQETYSASVPSATLTVNSVNDSSYGGYLRDDNSTAHVGSNLNLTKTGTGNLTLTGPNIIYGGDTSVTAGTLTLLNAPNFRSQLNIGPGAVVVVDGVGSWTNNKPLSGAGTFRIAGGSSVNLNGNVVMTGAIDIQSGTLKNGLSTVSWAGNTAKMSLGTSAQFDMNGVDVTVDALSSVDNTSVIFNSGVSKTLTIGAAGGSGDFAGNIFDISGNGSPITVVKLGTGTQTFSGANSYSGATDIRGGTLALGISGSIASPTISLAAGTTFDVSAVSGYDLSGKTLLGKGAVIGAVTTGNGTALRPGGATDNGTLTFANDLTLNGGLLAMKLQSPGNDKIQVGGSLNLLSSTDLQLSGSFTNGTYPLISFTGNLSGSLSNLVLPSSPSRQTYSLVSTGSKNAEIDLKVIGKAGHLVWTGAAGNHAWDVAKSVNWNNSDTHVADKFYSNDEVTFNDTSSVGTVIIDSAGVNPSKVTVNNSTTEFTFSGGPISDGATLIKSGSGKLNLNSANTFTGGTTINGGTVVMGDPNALGLPVGGSYVTVNAGGTLDFSSNSLPSGATVTLNGNGSAGQGAITGYVGLLDSSVTLGLASNASIGATLATWRMDGAITGAGFVATKVGNGILELAGPNSVGGFAVQEGTLLVDNTTALGNGTVQLTVNSGGTATLMLAVSEPVSNFTSALTLHGGTLTTDGERSLEWSGPVTLAAATSSVVSVAGDAAPLNISGTISGSGTMIKSGGGPLTLSGNNTFTNGITIQQGRLVVGGTGAFNATTPQAVRFAADSSSATLQMNGISATVSSIVTDASDPASSVVENGSASVPATLTIDSKVSSTFAGTIRDGAAGRMAINKQGTGTLVLTGPNTYTGGTTVGAGGAIRGAVGPLQGNIVNNGSVIFDQPVDATFSSAISTSAGQIGSVTKLNSGVLTLAVPQLYHGPTIVSQGTLRLASQVSSLAGFNGGTGWTLNTFSETGTDQPITIAGDEAQLTNGVNGVANSMFYDLPVPMGAGAWQAKFSMRATPDATNHYADGGALVFQTQGLNALGGNGGGEGVGPQNGRTAIQPAAAIVWKYWNANQTTSSIQYCTGDTTVAGDLTAPVNIRSNTPTEFTVTYDGVNSITVIAVQGANTWSKTYTDVNLLSALNGSTTAYIGFTGATGGIAVNQWISNFTYNYSGAGVLPFDTAVTVADGATLDINGVNQTIGSLADAAGATGKNKVLLGAGTLTMGGDDSSTTFKGTISGTGGIAKAGSGTMILSADNPFTGATTISGGTLALDATGQISHSSGIMNDGTFEVLAGSHFVAAISGNGMTKVVTGSLTSSSIVQDALIIGGFADSAKPVPEPSSLTLVLAVFAGLVGWLLRRRS